MLSALDRPPTTVPRPTTARLAASARHQVAEELRLETPLAGESEVESVGDCVKLREELEVQEELGSKTKVSTGGKSEQAKRKKAAGESLLTYRDGVQVKYTPNLVADSSTASTNPLPTPPTSQHSTTPPAPRRSGRSTAPPDRLGDKSTTKDIVHLEVASQELSFVQTRKPGRPRKVMPPDATTMESPYEVIEKVD